ncbi:MAG: hypothetical protein KatS3mg010_1568 [Acidimicrobiia bacterium]|nr:MAG: hypothetical protein KatS3mg010_1568 [Acidimicrobiia bacterium]
MSGRARPPDGLRPMTAVLGPGRRRRAGGWAFELKWDGLRALAYVVDGRNGARAAPAPATR